MEILKKYFRNLLKSKLLIKSSRAFTLVELLISILIFSAFIGTLMYMFSKGSRSFQITSWKQQKTSQAQLFWTILKNNIEGATNNLSTQIGVANPDITILPRPLLFNSNASTCKNGNILAWGNTNVNFATSPPYNNTTSTNIFILQKKGNQIYLKKDGKIIAKFTDVNSISIKITSVVRDSSTKEEYLHEGVVGNAIGALVSISITLKPPKGYVAQNLKLVQNHKFRINIKAKGVTNPTYP